MSTAPQESAFPPRTELRVLRLSSWRWSNLGLRSKALIGIVLTAIAIVGFSLLFRGFEREVDEAELAVNRTHAIDLGVDGVLRAIAGAEAHVRDSGTPMRPPRDPGAFVTRELSEALAQLKRLMLDPSRSEGFERIRMVLQATRLEVLAGTIAQTGGADARLRVATGVQEPLERLEAELYGLRERENERLSINQERLKQARSRSRTATQVSLILLGFGAALAIMVLTLGIAGRIEALALNLTLFTQGLPLRPMPERDDELGRLARGLFQASELLAERETGREAELREARGANAKLFTILEATPEVAIIATGVDGNVSIFNSGAERMLGYSAENVVGGQLPKITVAGSGAGAEGEGSTSSLAESSNAEGYRDQERTYVHNGGAHISVSETLAPIRDSGGQVCGYLRTAIDIGARRRLEEDLQQVRQSIEEANRSRTGFLARMSHEIRSPMNAILGMAQLLYETELTGEQRQYTHIFCTNTELLLNVINDVLDLSKVEAGSLELDVRDFDLYRVVEKTAELIADWAHRRGLEFNCHISPGTPWRLRGDPDRLGQLLVNLIGNAIKFTESGEVSLRVERNPEGDGAPLLKFSVSDTGPGIPEDQRDAIFNSFRPVDATNTGKFGGAGTGLPISKNVVELMGGRIWIESEAGRGSAIQFTADFESDPVYERPFEIPAAIQNLKVLIAVPGATSRLFLRETLTDWGLAAAEAVNGEEALAELGDADRLGAPYDVILADCQLPDMRGLDFAACVQHDPQRRRLVILMLTGDPNHEDILQCNEKGVRSLSKPVMIRALLGELTEAFASRPAPVKKLAAREPLAVRPHRILLADDSSDCRFLVRAYIQNRPYKIDVAENGRIAVEMAGRTKYDLILMDVQMPVMDGYSAVREIRQHEETAGVHPVPILALSAHALLGDLQRSRAAGCNDHLSKPISRPDLLEAIERHSLTQSLKAPVTPEAGLEEIVPRYLARRIQDLDELTGALAREDFDRIRTLGHDMKGTGEAYGFPAITEIGAALEAGALGADPEEIRLQTAALREFLAQLEAVNA